MYKLIHLVHLEIEYQKISKRMKLLIVTHKYFIGNELLQIVKHFPIDDFNLLVAAFHNPFIAN